MLGEPLIVEDLLLLMLDPASGVPAKAGTLHYPLGGALLVELALLGRVDSDGEEGLNGVKVIATGNGALPDPLLQTAYDKVAERTQRVQPLLLGIGGGLLKPVRERLLERGFIHREKKKVLGLFPANMMPTSGTQHETALRSTVSAILTGDEEPDTRTAAVVALLSSSGALPSLHPNPKWSSKVYHRGKEFEHGNWGAAAVNTAVARTTAAIAASSAAVAVAVTTGSGAGNS